MRTILSICLLLGTCFAQAQGDNQPWCPPGANWVYKVFSPNSTRYYEFTYTKDTAIAGKTAKKLSVSRIEYYDNNFRVIQPVGAEFFYNSNDSIYFYDSGAFRFIYSFSPTVGDKWVTGTTRSFCGSGGYPLQDTFKIVSITDLVLGSKTFKYIRDSSTTKYFTLGNVIKNIGPEIAPFPIVDPVTCQASDGTCGKYFERLVCYSDNTRGTVQINNPSNYDCNSIITYVPVHLDPALTYTIYRNPTVSTLFVKHDLLGSIRYTIVDASGKVVALGLLTAKGIETSGLSAGVYYLSLTSKNDRTTVLKFVKQ